MVKKLKGDIMNAMFQFSKKNVNFIELSKSFSENIIHSNVFGVFIQETNENAHDE